jgi:hypothetical protein
LNKRYISPAELLRDAYRLGWQVYESGYRPDVLIGVWRGGAPVAVAVHELLHILGVRPDHLAVRTASYSGIAERQRGVRVDGLEYLAPLVGASQRLLYAPHHPEIRLATPWYKPGNNRTGRKPDYHINESEDWLVFPHELEGLTVEEIAQHKPELSGLLDSLAPHLVSG